MLLEEYLGALRRCRTDNEIRRINIEIEFEWTPANVCALIDEVRARRPPLPDFCAAWIENMDRMVRGGGRPVEQHVGVALAPCVTLYAGAGDAATRARRTLMLAFAGGAGRMMLPLPMFLQYCPTDRFEVLVMIDYRRQFYLRGMEGLGDDLPSMLDAIAARFPQVRQGNAISFGTSAGGLAAVWSAVALGLPRAISIAGATPESVRSSERVDDDVVVDGFDEAIRRAGARLPKVFVVAGAGAARDVARAHEMQGHLPATYIGVPGGTRHNVLHEAWQNGLLDGLMDRLLNAAE